MSKRHIWRVLAWLGAAIAVVAAVSYALAPQAWRQTPGGIAALIVVASVGVVGFIKNVVDIVTKTAQEPPPREVTTDAPRVEPSATPGAVFDQRGQTVGQQINVGHDYVDRRTPGGVREQGDPERGHARQALKALLREVGLARKIADHNCALPLDDTPQQVQPVPVDRIKECAATDGLSEELVETLQEYLVRAGSVNSLVDSYGNVMASGQGTRPLQMGVPGSGRGSSVVQQVAAVCERELLPELEAIETLAREELRSGEHVRQGDDRTSA